jgi:streptogramin lyase
MFSARDGFGTFSKTVAERVAWLVGVFVILCSVVSAQSLNINITEYQVPGPAIAQTAAITAGPDGALWFTQSTTNLESTEFQPVSQP